MISAIAASAADKQLFLPSKTSSGDASSNDVSSSESALAGAAIPAGADELSLSQPDSKATSVGFYQRSSLKIRAHSHVKVTEDGQVRARSHTKLRFNYSFEAADGTKVRIRVKANLNYSQRMDAEGESQSMKLVVKAKVSVLQENVSNGIASILDATRDSAEAANGILQALGEFNQVADAAGSQFQESSPIDGDSLIAGLVEAFNGLSEALSSIFLSPPADPEAVPSNAVVESPGQVASDPVEVLTAEQGPIETVSPTIVESKQLLETPPQEIVQAGGLEHEFVPSVGQEATSTVENELPGETSEPEYSSDRQGVEPADDVQSQLFVASAMFKIRFQVVQSLQSLVAAFDDDSPSSQGTHSHISASAKFSAFSFSRNGVNAALPQGNRIDTQV